MKLEIHIILKCFICKEALITSERWSKNPNCLECDDKCDYLVFPCKTCFPVYPEWKEKS